MIERNRQCLFKRNTFAQTREEALHADAIFSGPITDALTLPEGGQDTSAPAIARLHGADLPRAIVRFITVCIVSPIQRMIRRWSLADISEKCRERFTPAFADDDATATIVFKGARFWIMATVFHRVPDAVFRLVASVVRQSQTAHAFALVTAARFRQAAFKIAHVDEAFVATVALTPILIAPSGFDMAWDVFDRRQSILFSWQNVHAPVYRKLASFHIFGAN